MLKKVFYYFIIQKFYLVQCATTVLPHSAATNGMLAVATTVSPATSSEKTLYEKGVQDYDEERESIREARGMPDDDFELDHHHEVQKMEEPKAAIEDPWQSYYDFIINEGSFKFWAVFQLVTAALLVYSAFAAVYYAKFNVITTDYDYYDDFYGRGRSNEESSSIWSGLSSQTFQRIMDAIKSKKFS